MLFKPFKPPSFKQSCQPDHEPSSSNNEPPTKRRRVSENFVDKNQLNQSLQKGRDEVKISSQYLQQAVRPRTPLDPVSNLPEGCKPAPNPDGAVKAYYAVLYRKLTNKKHKTWDGDGFLTVRDGLAVLQDVSGREMARTAFDNPLLPGSTLCMGGKDVEVDTVITKGEYADRICSSKSTTTGKRTASAQATTSAQPPLRRETHENLHANSTAATNAAQKSSKRPDKYQASNPSAIASATAFKNPLKDSTVIRQIPGEKLLPRHDPDAPNALVMRRPRTVPPGKQVVDVVLDPLLTKSLRPHQREGVAFLYECVMGIRDFGGEGCILADEMGLGKTLQTISLLWTLLKQNPFGDGEPVIKKALIVCPVTLIVNWQKEFRKWLGNERIGVFVADGKKTRLTDFTMGKSYSVMIIGYERLRTVAEDLTKGPGIDIVIADEGHRLKTVQNKSAQAIQSLNTPRRVILSGTPIQNDLSEFFSMVNFVNDGLLGSYRQFVKRYEQPIVKSRQPMASNDALELGQDRSAELAQETSKFILRRTANILSKYLPPKTEYVLFCEPTKTQANLYRHILAAPIFQNAFGSSECALQLINILKKLSNSPSLISSRAAEADDNVNSASVTALLESLPRSLLQMMGPQASAKIRILDSFLYTLSRRTSEKIVLVSNYTSSLDVLQNLLTSLSLPFLRLDGSTPSSKRQSLVDDFNRSSSTAVFAFLLSAKAGGLGLNLVGASRLVLFDVDWNPAVEEQAMARIHRQGQRMPCRIYRFVLKGGLEERVWQRQVVKRGLANSIMDGGATSGSLSKKGVAQFSRDELRDLFRLDQRPDLRTHDLIGCACGGRGQPAQQNPAFSPDGEAEGVGSLSAAGRKVIYLDDEDDEESLPDLSTVVHAATARNFGGPNARASNDPQPSGPSATCNEHGTKSAISGLTDYSIHINTSWVDPVRCHRPQIHHQFPSQQPDRDFDLDEAAEPDTTSSSSSSSSSSSPTINNSTPISRTIKSRINDEILFEVLQQQAEDGCNDDDDDDDDDDKGRSQILRGEGGRRREGGGREKPTERSTTTPQQAVGGSIAWVFIKR